MWDIRNKTNIVNKLMCEVNYAYIMYIVNMKITVC